MRIMKATNILVGRLITACLMSCSPPAELKVSETIKAEDANDDDTSNTSSPITWEDCSGAVGDKACDFTFVDQNGDEWNLYEHYGTVMILDFSTVWCGVCRTIAGDVQMHQDTFTAMGYDFLWVTILVDGNTWGVPPTKEEIDGWVISYGMTTSPVLRGDRSIIDAAGMDGYPVTGWPTIVIVDEELTITHGINGWSESSVMGWVESVLAANR
jgi:hypothetical protein